MGVLYQDGRPVGGDQLGPSRQEDRERGRIERQLMVPSAASAIAIYLEKPCTRPLGTVCFVRSRVVIRGSFTNSASSTVANEGGDPGVFRPGGISLGRRAALALIRINEVGAFAARESSSYRLARTLPPDPWYPCQRVAHEPLPSYAGRWKRAADKPRSVAKPPQPLNGGRDPTGSAFRLVDHASGLVEGKAHAVDRHRQPGDPGLLDQRRQGIQESAGG